MLNVGYSHIFIRAKSTTGPLKLAHSLATHSGGYLVGGIHSGRHLVVGTHSGGHLVCGIHLLIALINSPLLR